MSPTSTASRHSRNSSAADSIQEIYRARKLSKSSLHEASNPLESGLSHEDSMHLNAMNNTGLSASNPLGNLADELADAFSDSSEEDDDDQGQDTVSDTVGSKANSAAIHGSRDAKETTPRTSPDGNRPKHETSLRIPSSERNRRKNVPEYDGSEYGSESELDCAGMPAPLVSKIDAIESLARAGTKNHVGQEDDVFRRVTEGLRDLGSQLTVEGNASRAITAHTALTTYLAHQTRQMYGLTFPLLSPLAPAPDRETIDDIIPLLVSLSVQMPRPSTFALSSLTALRSITSELIQTLSYLSDTLHMSRQTTVTATRRLKSAKELVSEIRRDEELREEGERWLSRGNWGERLASRECANVCGEVIGGFEDVCNGWRQRLLAQAQSLA